jgi:hypothetical protein
MPGAAEILGYYTLLVRMGEKEILPGAVFGRR